MRRMMLIAVMAAFSFAICSAEETPKMQDENDEINYSLGYQIGGDLKRQKVEIRSDLIIRGIKDAMTGPSPCCRQRRCATSWWI